MSTLLVTAATGQLGRLVLDALLADGQISPSDIIATSRDPSKLAAYAARGITARAADFDEPASLDAAFAGADRMLIISTDAMDEPGKRIRQHLAAVGAAQKAGAQHIVYTSMPNPETSVIPFAPDHLGTENAIKATGIPYTILRNGWYMENLFMSLPQAFASGKWYTSAAKGKVAYIAKSDLAQAIASALAAETTDSATYTLTGPETFDTDAIAQLAAGIVGKPLEVVHVTDEQYAGGLKAAGLPDFLIPMLVSFETNTREGHLDILTPDAARLAGKPLMSLADFLAANKATLAG